MYLVGATDDFTLVGYSYDLTFASLVPTIVAAAWFRSSQSWSAAASLSELTVQ